MMRILQLKEIDPSLPDLFPHLRLSIPMCGRTNSQVVCQHTQLVNTKEPPPEDKKLGYYIQPVIARPAEGQGGCSTCQMPHWPQS